MLLETIRDIYRRSRSTYGVPRVDGQLRRTGHRVARSRVARLMRAYNLVGAHASKKWRRGRRDAGGLPGLLQRSFVALAPNQRWVADVTEFPTGEGKLYLAGIRDLFHRGFVGWGTSDRRDSTLVVSALTMALDRTANPAEVIHHADKGSIDTSLDFAFAAGHADMALSFGSTADAYDNAAMETFWARLKVEINCHSGSRPEPKRTPTCSSSSRSSTTGNATKRASLTSLHPSTLTSGATTTENRIWHNPVSKKPGQVQVSRGIRSRVNCFASSRGVLRLWPARTTA